MLGGNDTTLAVANSFVPSAAGLITARLIPLARTPLGIDVGDNRTDVGIPLSGIFDWIDRTFAEDEDHAFITSLHDLDLLARIGWSAPFPERIDEASVVNLDDLPDEIADGITRPPSSLVQCAACRRLCVRDDFVWKEKQLCAWDYHAQVFGKRGPWHQGPYAERHFATAPSCGYVAVPLLEELGVEAVLTINAVDEEPAHAVINALLNDAGERSHMAVRTEGGFTVLRET